MLLGPSDGAGQTPRNLTWNNVKVVNGTHDGATNTAVREVMSQSGSEVKPAVRFNHVPAVKRPGVSQPIAAVTVLTEMNPTGVLGRGLHSDGCKSAWSLKKRYQNWGKFGLMGNVRMAWEPDPTRSETPSYVQENADKKLVMTCHP